MHASKKGSQSNPQVNLRLAPALPPDSRCGMNPHPPFAHIQVFEQSMTLTKARIVEALCVKNIFTKAQPARIIDTLFEPIKQSLQNGEDVLVSGFGKFWVKMIFKCFHPMPGKPGSFA